MAVLDLFLSDLLSSHDVSDVSTVQIIQDNAKLCKKRKVRRSRRTSYDDLSVLPRPKPVCRWASCDSTMMKRSCQQVALMDRQSRWADTEGGKPTTGQDFIDSWVNKKTPSRSNDNKKKMTHQQSLFKAVSSDPSIMLLMPQRSISARKLMEIQDSTQNMGWNIPIPEEQSTSSKGELQEQNEDCLEQEDDDRSKVKDEQQDQSELDSLLAFYGTQFGVSGTSRAVPPRCPVRIPSQRGIDGKNPMEEEQTTSTTTTSTIGTFVPATVAQ